MSPITLVAAETYLTKTRRTNTIATGVTSPPGPTLIITLTTTLTRYKHKLLLLINIFQIVNANCFKSKPYSAKRASTSAKSISSRSTPAM